MSAPGADRENAGDGRSLAGIPCGPADLLGYHFSDALSELPGVAQTEIEALPCYGVQRLCRVPNHDRARYLRCSGDLEGERKPRTLPYRGKGA